MRVRRAGLEDVDAIARLHAGSLPAAFMTNLGPGFLRRLYRALVSDPDGICIAADFDGSVVGFACAVSSMPAFANRFRRRQGVAVAAALVPRLVSPGALRGLLENVRYSSNRDRLPQAEVISMAVAPRFRNEGVGSALLDAALNGLAERDVNEVMILEGGANGGAERLFASAGFQPHRRLQLHRGTESTIWVTTCRS